MKSQLLVCLVAIVAGAGALAAENEPAPLAPADAAFFEEKIRPLLIERCLDCHGQDVQEAGLRLDLKQGWRVGGESGQAIVPGHPEKSLLIKAVSYAEKDLKMPPDGQLPVEEIALLKDWVSRGAPDPRSDPLPERNDVEDDWSREFARRLDWWSLQPMRATEPPAVDDERWSREPIDRYLRAAQAKAGLKPADRAEPEVLLRRLSFVITGLPPTPPEREAFLKAWTHDADAAVEQEVDRLLASPHFGERFARHWMDVVRYTDTYGYEWDNPAKGSWEYRDYLVRAFNNDLAYDRFLREQIAGDLCEPRVDPALQTQENLIGPMFYHFGEHRHGSSLEFNGVHQEMIHNKIDAFSKAFLATTVACARCHNHKLEAVSQRDYYALAAVLMTPNWTSRQVDAPEKNAAAIAELKRLRRAIRDELSARWIEAAAQPEAWSAAKLRAALPAAEAPQPALGDAAYPLAKLLGPGAADSPAAWKTLAEEWHAQRTERATANAQFEVLADFATADLPAGWVLEGDGMRHGHVQEATPLIALAGEQVIERLLPRGLHTHALSSKLPGALHAPPQHLSPGSVTSVLLAGSEFGGYLIKHANAFQGEEVTFLNSPLMQWRSFGDIPLRNGISKITVEFATASLNSNFPPRTGLAPGLPHEDFGYDKRSTLSIGGIVAHNAGGTPLDPLDLYAGLWQQEAPETPEQVEQRIAAWFNSLIGRWSEGKLEPGEGRMLDWLLTSKLLPNDAPPESKLAELLAEYRRVEGSIEFPRTVNSLDERAAPRLPYPLNVRGNVDLLGEEVLPDFLSLFSGQHRVAESGGSGRLELAESLLAPEHPLTSRVYVNRVWQWVFGTGLVATPDDFGRLGEKPSHPELLDYLALEFQREGWSSKRLIRQLVLSETFRQSGRVHPEARERDPANRLLHHYSTRRLEAEAIRDSLLAVSGRLDRSLYGRPILPHRVAQDSQKRLFTGPVDGHGRRSLYLQMSIMEPPKFLVGFNLPDLKLPTGRRDATSVPTQSLLLLNDPFPAEMARHWAARLIAERHATPEERLEHMFLEAFARFPSTAERERWLAALRDFASPDAADLLTDEPAWTRLAHAMFNAKEFVYVR
jgi:cytochrome c553